MAPNMSCRPTRVVAEPACRSAFLRQAPGKIDEARCFSVGESTFAQTKTQFARTTAIIDPSILYEAVTEGWGAWALAPCTLLKPLSQPHLTQRESSGTAMEDDPVYDAAFSRTQAVEARLCAEKVLAREDRQMFLKFATEWDLLAAEIEAERRAGKS
jgi:hypothetical protein